MKNSKNKITRKRKTSKIYGGYVVSDTIKQTSKSKSTKKTKK